MTDKERLELSDKAKDIAASLDDCQLGGWIYTLQLALGDALGDNETEWYLTILAAANGVRRERNDVSYGIGRIILRREW